MIKIQVDQDLRIPVFVVFFLNEDNWRGKYLHPPTHTPTHPPTNPHNKAFSGFQKRRILAPETQKSKVRF